MFEPVPGSDEVWRRVAVAGTAANQAALELTLRTLGGGRDEVEVGAEDIPVMLVALGTRWRVNAVDVHAAGGLIGHLPEHAVRAVGESIRATHRAHDQPCAVRSRIVREGSGVLAAEVLLPEVFEPGDGPLPAR